MAKQQNNIAYIDGQNLHIGTAKRSKNSWVIDLAKFRVYLKDKYKIKKAYYYLGFVNTGKAYEELYEEIQSAGFILVFREHNSAMLGKKKGNVDSDIIFNAMKRLCLKEDFDKIMLISGDGDYKMLVDFLIEQERFLKILFPDGSRRSSLYKTIGLQYFDALDKSAVKKKIEKQK